jgi:hypothetical protein
MKTKGIIVASVALTIGIGVLYFWLDRKKERPEDKLKTEEKPEII